MFYVADVRLKLLNFQIWAIVEFLNQKDVNNHILGTMHGNLSTLAMNDDNTFFPM